MSAPADTVRSLILATGGLVVWAAHFGLMYAAQTAFCTLARQPGDATSLRLFAFALTAIALVVLIGFGLALLARAGRGAHLDTDSAPARFLRETSVAIIGVSLIAVLWSPVALLLSACGAPAAA